MSKENPWYPGLGPPSRGLSIWSDDDCLYRRIGARVSLGPLEEVLRCAEFDAVAHDELGWDVYATMVLESLWGRTQGG